MAIENQIRPSSGILPRLMSSLGFLCLYLPLVCLVTYSFIQSQPDGTQVWTLQWYQKLVTNDLILKAFYVSLWVGLCNTLVATLIGTAAALALTRSQFPGRKIFNAFTYVPLIMPEIVLGLALLIWFVLLRVTLGVYSIILAHVTFSVSYVIITVKSRLEGLDLSLEEAARDLGANSWMAFWKVTFPLIWPGIFSGALMAFTLSFDDFLITYFTAGVGSDTLPLKIYSMIKYGVSPEVNALSTIMLTVTFLLVSLFFRSNRKVDLY